MVTGAGAGLGRAEALELARAGASIVLNDLPGSADAAAAEIEELGAKCVVVEGDVGERATADALVTAAMEQIPEKLLQRLEPGGILIAPVGPHHGTQTLVRVTRKDSGFERKELVDVRFVPALPGIAREL